MYYRPGTGGRFVFIYQVAARFVWNDVIVAILKVWRQIENQSIDADAYLLEEQLRQISSRSDLKRWS